MKLKYSCSTIYVEVLEYIKHFKMRPALIKYMKKWVVKKYTLK